MLSSWRERLLVIVAGIVCLGVGVFFGRIIGPGAHPHDVSVNTQTYHTCMYLYNDVPGCAEVMKRLAGAQGEVN
jgi:hypothetical protein